MSSKSFQKAGLMAAAFTLSAPLFVSTATAADTATANASADIIAAIAITKTSDLDFGSIVADATTAGTVVIDTAGAETCTTVECVISTRSAAAFSVTGQVNQAYTVTLPADGTITLSDGTNTMAVDGFTHNAAETLATSPETFSVGATLSVGAAQVAGAYTGTFDVIVDYN